MIKTLDIMESNMFQLMAIGMNDTFISLPVIRKREDGSLELVSFCWSQNKKQRNVPKPDTIVVNSIVGGASDILECPESKIANVVTSRTPNNWAMTKLTNELDIILNEYLGTGRFPTYKYLQYLENMLPMYSEDYYPLFAVLNHDEWDIDILKEAK